MAVLRFLYLSAHTLDIFQEYECITHVRCVSRRHRLTLGETPEVCGLLSQLLRGLGKSAEESVVRDAGEGRVLLGRAFAGSKILLVLDDAWQTRHATPFVPQVALPRLSAPHCVLECLLLRGAQAVTRLAVCFLCVDVFSSLL